jgi:hypothetical protein
MKNSGANVWGQNLTGMTSNHQKLEVIPVLGDSHASLSKNSQFKWAL